MTLTTSRLALPYPEALDQADVPADIFALANKLDANAAWFSSGLHSAMPAVGSVPTSALYFSTDKGMLWEKISGAWTLIYANAVNWTSTTLPASPVDGQRISYQPTAGVRWLMRYNSTFSAWECEGDGDDYYTNSEPACSTVTATPQIILPALAIIIPNAGKWEFEWGHLQLTGINNASAGILLTSKPQGGGIATIGIPSNVQADELTYSSPATGASFGAFNTTSRKAQFNITPAGSTISLTHAHQNLTSAPGYYHRWMSARPVSIN